MFKFPLTLVTALVLLGAAVSAQSVYTFDIGAPGIALPTYLPSASYPAGGPGFTGPIPLPGSGAAGAPFPDGGIAIDQTTSRVFCTDGFLITTDFHGLYLPFSPPFAPAPPMPAPALGGGGPITGMGADPTTGTLWLTDGVSYAPATLGAPFALLAPPMPLGPVLGAAGAPLTGIDFDAATGTLWGCDAGGAVYNWIPFGGPVGPQPVGGAGSPAGIPITGIAVNEGNGPGAIGIPFCSTQIPGYHVVVTDGFAIFDAMVAGNPPIPNPFASGMGARGLAYSADQQYLPGAGMAPIPTGLPGWAKPQHNGPGGMNALRLVGSAPGTAAIFMYDLCPVPGGLVVPFSGETLWINPLSPGFAFAPLLTDAIGEITVPIDFSPAMAGLTFTGQFGIFSPLSPLGYALTDAMQFTVGLQ